MLNKQGFLTKYPDVQEGMVARTMDGEKLGKVSAMNEDSFTVQKGIFFPKDFMFRYEDIEDFRDGELVINQGLGDLSEWKDTSYPGWTQVEDINAGKLNAQPKDEYRVPVMEEELETQKTSKQAGEIQLRKVVHTELRHFTVPVTREEVRVERVPASEATQASGLGTGEAPFEEKTVRVPVMEEEVTVAKTPKLKEEIRVTKERREEPKEISGEIRKEEVQIEGEEELKRKKAG